MPAYNEEANIKETLDAWYPIIERHNESGNSCLTVVNDGSKDNTYKIMLEYAETHPLFVPLTKENGGHGSAVIFAYNHAVNSGADWIFQTDSDGQTLPSEFQQFWDCREDYDAVMGNRKKRGDGADRKFVENVLRTYLWFFFGPEQPTLKP